MGASPVLHWYESSGNEFNELAKISALPLESYLIELCMPLASVKLDIECKFFLDASLFWANDESCST